MGTQDLADAGFFGASHNGHGRQSEEPHAGDDEGEKCRPHDDPAPIPLPAVLPGQQIVHEVVFQGQVGPDPGPDRLDFVYDSGLFSRPYPDDDVAVSLYGREASGSEGHRNDRNMEGVDVDIPDDTDDHGIEGVFG